MERNSYPGHLMQIEFNGGIRTKTMNCTITHKVEFSEKQYVGTRPVHRSIKSEDLEIELEFENSSDLNGAGLLSGTGISSFNLLAKEADGTTVNAVPAELFADDRFPVASMAIGEVGTKIDSEKDTMLTVKIVCNVDDLLTDTVAA